MRDYNAAHDRSAPIAPFSNSTDGGAWEGRWCENCLHCNDCPLLLLALTGRTPVEWEMRNPAGTHDKYVCTEYGPVPGGIDARTGETA